MALVSLSLFAPPVAASSPTVLSVANFGRILVDPSTSHVFASSPGSGAIVVLDFTGTVVTTITGEAGADAMALNGSTLYVALTTAGTIDRIDTGTLMETSPLVTGLRRPNDLVYAGSKLWIPAGDCASPSWSVQLVSVDPATSPPVVTTFPNAFTITNLLAYCAYFATNPTANPNLLLAWSRTLPTTIASYDVSSGIPVRQVLTQMNFGFPDAAVNPDGTHFIAAGVFANPPNAFTEFDLSTLQPDGVTYPLNPYPTSVATSAADGGLMAAGIRQVDNQYDFYAYVIGRPPPIPLTKVSFSSTYTGVPTNTVWPRGVAIKPDGSSAFVMSQGTGFQVVFNVVPIPAPGPPQPPTNVGAVPGVDSATVSWAPPVDQGGYPVTSYTVSRSPGGVVATVNAPTTSLLVSALTYGVSYTFTVTAANALGSSGPSAPSNAVSPKPRPPGPPSNVTAFPGDGEAFVSWSPPTDLGEAPPITGYVITLFPLPVGQSPWLTVTGSPPLTAIVYSGLTNGVTYIFFVAAITSAGTGPQSAASNPVKPIQGGNYHPLVPTRILDTRSGVGAPMAPLGPGASLRVQITGQGTVPTSGVSAVVMNVTVTNTSTASYLTIYPSGASRPFASNLNWVPGQTVPNLVEVAIGEGGGVTVYNAGGQADVIFDVAGWVGDASNSLVKDGLYNPVVPYRVMDTRNGTGGVPQAPVGPGQVISVRVAGTSNLPASGVGAVVLNVTVTGATAASHLTVFPTGAQKPLASNLNFVANQTVPNRVIVKVGTDPVTGTSGWVSFFNAAGSVNVIADVGGWFTDGTSLAGGTRFSGIIPKRIFDSREPGSGGPIGPGETVRLTLLDSAGNPVSGVFAVVVNVTVTNPTAPSYLTLWPDGATRPLASDLNFVPGQTVPNLVVVQLGPFSTIDIYNLAGSADMVVDLVGIYGMPQSAPAAQPATMRLSRATDLH